MQLSPDERIAVMREAQELQVRLDALRDRLIALTCSLSPRSRCLLKAGQASVEVVKKLAQDAQLIHDFGELGARSLRGRLG